MKTNILVLCTGNSCRSQMAHGFLAHYGGDKVQVDSAGIETHGINPFAVGIMAESGIDISKHTSDLVDKYLSNKYDLVLTVCDHANEVCPVFLNAVKKSHHNFTDPSKATGTATELIAAFRQTRKEIDTYCQKLIAAYVK
jgi:arsenate reductase